MAPADVVIRGAVRTLASPPRGGGLVVRDGRVGEVPGEAPDGGERLPDGACVVPGFTDSHAHLLSWSSSLREVHLVGTRSRAEVLARVAADRGSGWVRGYGWAAEAWAPGDAPPTRAALDTVTGDRPAALLAHDWHTLWVNTAALALAGDALEVPGGVVERDADGVPTGLLREAAAWAFRDRHSLPGRDELRDALRAALPEVPARGIVAVHDKDGMLGCVEVARELRDELPFRIRHSVPADRMDDPGAHYVKAFMDGTLGSRTARLIGGGGVEVTSRGAFEAIVRRAAALRKPVAVHAIGDQAVRDALDAFAASADAWRGLRPRIEHAQCVAPEDVPRFAALGVTASVQPSMAVTDQALAERLWADRLERAYAYGTLARAGARLAGGSDAPVEPLEPLDGMRCAVLRTRGDTPPWRPQEALDVDTALRAWTATPAWLEGAEAGRGTLAVGRAADAVVLDRDPYEDLAGARVIGTLQAGRWTYRAF